MHDDREIFAKALARQLGRKSVRPCTPEVAERHTGYKVGGTSPFGLARPLSVYRERSIGELSRIYINGGARGFLVELEPAALDAVLRATPVDVAI